MSLSYTVIDKIMKKNKDIVFLPSESSILVGEIKKIHYSNITILSESHSGKRIFYSNIRHQRILTRIVIYKFKNSSQSIFQLL